LKVLPQASHRGDDSVFGTKVIERMLMNIIGCKSSSKLKI
jgi:hypothetical protein